MDQSFAHSGSERPFSGAVHVNGTAQTGPPTTTSMAEPEPQLGVPISRQERVATSGSDWFLIATFVLGLIGWLVVLVSQAIVAATISHGPVRILWFGFVMQTIITILVLEVIRGSTRYNAAYAYGTQISIFAALATVFAVFGVDQNIYSSPSAQKATGAGWLILAVVDLLWILFFTSPPQSPVVRIVSSSSSTRNAIGQDDLQSGKVEKIGRSTDAFPMSALNGSQQQRASAAPSQQRKSGMPWSTYTSPAAPGGAVDAGVAGIGSAAGSGQRATVTTVPSDEARSTMHGGTAGVDGSEAQSISVRPDSGTAPFTESALPTATSQPDQEPMWKWKAEALFDYNGSPDDSNELAFKKNEVLFIYDKSGKWWEAKTVKGRKGIAPSNYLRLL